MGDQQFIQQLLDNTYPILNDPNSSYYLPTFMKNNGYDPYGPFNWNLSSLTDQKLIDAAATICPTISIASTTPCGKDLYYISFPPPPYPSLELNNCQITGMSNCVSERPIAGGSDGRQITIQMDFSTLTGGKYPAQVTISGEFAFTQYCACSADGTKVDGQAQPEVGRGTFAGTIPSSNLIIHFAITQLATNVLTLGVTSVAFNIPNDTDGGPKISISIDITSIPEGANRESYNNVAMEAFQAPGSRTQILQQINVAMNLPSILEKVGSVLTAELDGYLKANNKYPFGSSLGAVI